MKILVRIPNWLGDAVMATPTLQILKKTHTKATITLLGPAYLKELFDGFEYIIDDTKKSKNRIIATYRLAKSIGQFDIAITMQNTFLSALLLFWTNSKERIGFNKNFRSLFLTNALSYKNNIHQVLRYAMLSGSKACNESLILNIQKKHSTNNVIAIAPGAAFGLAKCWPFFYECLEILSKQNNFEIIILGSSSDSKICNELYTRLESIQIKSQNLVGQTSLKELIQIISGATLFLTNDSGPMHIGAALNTPTIAIFGSTDPSLTGPWMAKNCIVVYNKINCSPCFRRECKFGTYECLRIISPEYVAKLATKVFYEQ